jgi:hypothetical protein
MNTRNWNYKGTCLYAVLLTAALATAGCAMQPDLNLLRLSESTLEIRAMQTRTFAAASEAEILAATAAALQDMEYTIDQIESPLGIITATKISDADSASEKFGTIMLSLLCACDLTTGWADKHQITITTVVLPSLVRSGEYVTRITIQQLTYGKQSQIVSRGTIDNPEAYQSIFEKLSKALFIEVNDNA